jgi:2-(1,2-epoxy-1,2-dihydrophenyl)acetyl-CoA isomerase
MGGAGNDAERPVLLERSGAIATITLNRPALLNALNGELAQQLYAAVQSCAADEAIRCVVLRGAGRGFMAGGDIKSFRERLNTPGGPTEFLFEPFHGSISLLRSMAKPVIASLHGPVAGAGVSLALAPDLAIAAESAVFTLAYTRIGTSPDGGSTYLLPRIVGLRRALEIALLAENFDARQALDWGVVNRVVPDEQLAAETARMAERLAGGPTAAYAKVKALLNKSLDQDLAAQLSAEEEFFRASTRTRDFAEGVNAFLDKRRPGFVGS